MADIIDIKDHRPKYLEVWSCGECDSERFYLPKVEGENCICADCGCQAIGLHVVSVGADEEDD